MPMWNAAPPAAVVPIGVAGPAPPLPPKAAAHKAGPKPKGRPKGKGLPKINISLNWFGRRQPQNPNCPNDFLLWDTSGTRPENH